MTTSEMAAGVRPGDVLAGKYQVERVLGEGGMGVVVSAHHLHLDERVAIKFLLPDALKNEEAVARFDREARAAVKIKSEHVARVIDVGRLESGAPYMVMEYLEGSDLDAWLQKYGPMPVEQAAEFVLQACEAIAEAHALGIVHRDLKPANLFCVRRADGVLSIKVLDFGISKMQGATTSGRGMALTRTNTSMGTPLYMSPEQMASSSRADARSDIWSLGVILYELCSGSAPFEGEGLPELVLKIATGTPRALREVLPQVPPAFEAVVGRCLARDPAHRFADVAELAVALAPHVPARAHPGIERIQRTLHAGAVAPPSGGLGFGASPSSLGVAPTALASSQAVGHATSGAWGSATPARAASGRRSVITGMTLAIGLGIAAGAGALLMRRSASTSQGNRPPSASASAAPAGDVTAPPAPAAPTVAPSAPVASAEPAASGAPAASPSASATAAGHAPPARPGHVPAAPATGATQTAGAPGSRPGCNPPFTIDASGTKIFKKECL